MIRYFAVKKSNKILDAVVILKESHTVEFFKQTIENSPQQAGLEVWRENEISEVTKEEYEQFLADKEVKDEADLNLSGSEIADEDVKPLLAAVVSGNMKVAKKILEKSRKKPKDPVKEEPKKEEPVKEEPKKEEQ